MGTIVTLPAPRRPRRATIRNTEEATILLFMGVRYVRDDEPPTPVERTEPRRQHCEDGATREFA